MIKPAQLYTEELRNKFWEIAYDPHYMFVNDGHSYNYIPPENSYNSHDFVSVSRNGELLGYIKYEVNQRANYVYGFCAVNFSDSIIFAKDLFRVIDEIFCRYKFNKIKYGVFVGNPIEKTYDKLTKKYGGRVIGIAYNDAKLIDGNFYHSKMYEIHREDYLKHKK